MSKPPRSGEGRTLTSKDHSVTVRGTLATYRRYIPGTGPRLRPITLLPRAGSTAYIREELLVPRESTNDRKVHVVYLIGWTDLPAARITVDAEHIFDYVSAREFERWNYDRSIEREELEKKLEEEENIQLVREHLMAVQVQSAPGIVLRNGTLSINGDASARTSPTPKKKPGRPRKNVPSLSNPAAMEISSGFDLTEADTSNDEEAILRQLHEETQHNLPQGGDDFESTSSGSEPPMKKQRTASPASKGLSFNTKPVKSPGLIKETPVPVPRLPTRPNLLTGSIATHPTAASASRAFESSNSSSSKSTSFPAPAQRAHPGNGMSPKAPKLTGTPALQRPAKKKPPKQKQPKGPLPEGNPTDLVRFEPGQSWVVKHLLETKFFDDEDGNRVRHFKVLWKGEWPPDQNPTWEPEDNIPKAMARKFLLTHGANMGMDGVSDTPGKPRRQFSTVSEAFSGDDDGGTGSSEDEDEDEDDDEDDDEDEDEDTLRPGPSGENEQMVVSDEQTPRRSFQPSSFNWEMAMGRRFGPREGMAG